ncbi:hypothetical protein PR003_g26666 [Phytophthora rubi]|uniref:Uncharacterized protein n=1 Tax=Phytophthora rubi TaxID=129364 RepID=A0A6A4C724_9STRA|nr:hypothetical protein PR003_g26666 [Phytophthora rubi]
MMNASRQIDEATAEDRSRECNRSSSTVSDRPLRQLGTLQKLWTPTQKELGVFTAYWVINAGLPHHAIASKDLKLLIQRATGDLDATIISASTYRDF